ncbi:MAG: DsbA family protein [Pseudomonadota bacterium]
MAEPVDVFWSFRSPYSYLVTPDLLKLEEDYDVEVRLRVVFPIAIRTKATLFNKENRKPAMYIVMDSFRRAEFLGLPFAWPNPDPIVQNFETLEVSEKQPYIYRLSSLGVEAERRGKGIEFAAAVSRMIFGGTEGWDQGDHLANAASSVGLDLAAMDAAIADGDHLDAIEHNHEDLEAIGHWGVPTMALRGEPFFGQDRIETLRWRLQKLGVPKK